MANLLFQNAIVLDHTGQIARSIRIERDKITALDDVPGKSDFVFDLEGKIIMPGLINAHDHLAMNNFGKLKYRDVYSNAHEWSLDIEARFESDPRIKLPRAVPIADRLYHGALKNLVAGVTTVCHHDPWHRSLDACDFPIHVVKRLGYCHSLQRGGNISQSFQRTAGDVPWIIHLAEGTDWASAIELDTLEELGCLTDHTVVVHGVGLTREQRQKMAACGAGLIWCPSSNFFLLGKTADISGLMEKRLIALGTDSLLTAAGDVWDEFRAAFAAHQVTPRELFRFVGQDAARILRLKNVGDITIGSKADLLILPAPYIEPFNDFLNMTRQSVQLVLVDGKPRYGVPTFGEIFLQTRIAAEQIRVDGRDKLIAQSIARRIRRSSIPEAAVEL